MADTGVDADIEGKARSDFRIGARQAVIDPLRPLMPS